MSLGYDRFYKVAIGEVKLGFGKLLDVLGYFNVAME